MKLLIVTVLGTLVLSISTAYAIGGLGTDIDIYFLGNSLTRNLSQDRLEWLFTQAGGTLDYGSQLAGGAILHEHWYFTRDYTNNEYRANYIENGDYGAYTQAFVHSAFDAVLFQPYMNWVETDPDDYASFTNKIGDRPTISNFIGYALGDNPSGNVAASNFYVYCTWPRLLGIHYRNPDTPAPAPPHPDYGNSYTGYTYAMFFNEPYTNAVRWGQAQQTVPVRDFATQLVNGINADFPFLPRSVRLIPVGDVFARLDNAIRAGAVPGLEAHLSRPYIADYFANARKDDSRFPFPTNVAYSAPYGVVNFYADQVHMNDQPHNGDEEGTVGAYVAALTIYTTLSGLSPVGLPATDGTNGWQQFDPTLDADLIYTLQTTVWNTVINDPYTGVVIPEPMAALSVAGVASLLAARRR